MLRKSFVIVLLLLIIVALWASNEGRLTARISNPDESLVRLQAYIFDPLVEEPVFASALRAPELDEGEGVFILQFNGPVLPQWKDAVAKAGVRLYGYIPENAFIARMDATTSDQVQTLPFVRWVGPYHPAYALNPDVAGVRAAAAADMTTEVTVYTLPDTDLDALAATIKSWGGDIHSLARNDYAGYLRATLSSSRMFDLARQSGVLWIERYQQPGLLNDRGGGGVMRASEIRQQLGLYGANQIVAVADTGLDIGNTNGMHPDFQNKLAAAYCLGRPDPCDWSDPDGHGTHVSGSVLGSGVGSGANPGSHQYEGSGAGVAPEAKLVIQSIQDPQGGLGGIPDDNGDLMRSAYQEGARVHNNSWGGPTGGTPQNPEYGGYDTSSHQVDVAAWERKDMLILFAAGNSGTDEDGDGSVNPDSVGSPGTAKNVMTVGASENNRPELSYAWGDWWPQDYPANPIFSDRVADNPSGLAAFSSRGPTDDDRIKPDIVAPGSRVISARSHHPSVQVDSVDLTNNAHYKFSDGTSMATPLTAGAAAIVREWLVRIKGLTDPSGALMKATLINGAADMSPGQYGNDVPAFRPNIHSGWGRVDLVQSLNPGNGSEVWVKDETGGIGTGDTRSYQFTVGASQTVSRQDRPTTSAFVQTLTTADAIHPGGTNLIQNGGFESAGAWEMDSFERTDYVAHSGSWSAGSFPGFDGFIYQGVDIPANASAVSMNYYWLNENGDPGFDNLQATIYDEFFDALGAGPLHESEDTAWHTQTLNLDSILDDIRGQTIYVAFEVIQDAVEPDAGFYVDDVVLNVETSGGEPTPSPTPTSTPPPGATPTSTPPPGGGEEYFRITLAWTDYPGQPEAAKSLVNDLNLEVIAPGGRRYVGNQGTYTGGHCLVNGTWDACNNVEGIVISDAQAGTYTVVVHGANVPQGPQPFAVTASGSNLREGGGSQATPTLTPDPNFNRHLYLPTIVK